MRTVNAGLFYSVDGVVSDPHLWQYDSFDAELGAGMNQMIERTDTVLLGRVTYSQWSEFWPRADDDFGRFINPVQRSSPPGRCPATSAGRAPASPRATSWRRCPP